MSNIIKLEMFIEDSEDNDGKYIVDIVDIDEDDIHLQNQEVRDTIDEKLEIFFGDEAYAMFDVGANIQRVAHFEVLDCLDRTVAKGYIQFA